MLKQTLLILCMLALLGGCASAVERQCVAITNPNEKVLNGRIIEKEQIPGVINIPLPEGIELKQYKGFDYGMGVVDGLARAGPIGMVGAAIFPEKFGDPTPPLTVIGDKCKETSRVVSNGYRYLVVAEDGNKYTVLSAYSGFEIGECTKLFLVPRSGGGFSGRIASNDSCSNIP